MVTWIAHFEPGADDEPNMHNFSWPLHEGKNRLEMCVRNTSAVLGPVSAMELWVKKNGG